MVCFVRYYTPDICSAMVEVSDEADTRDNVSPHAHLKGFIKLPRCLVLNVSLVRLCVTQDGSSAHAHMHTCTHQLADGVSECRRCWNPQIAQAGEKGGVKGEKERVGRCKKEQQG